MSKIVAWFVSFFAGKAMQSIIKCIPVIVSEVELAMVDGKITAAERKTIAMKIVDTIAGEMGVKVTGFVRFAISMIIDAIAKKLPSKDIVIFDAVNKVIDAVPK